jgi:hypothetical protein
VLVVAPRCAVIASAPVVFVEVVASVLRPTVVDDTLTNRGCFVPAWCGLGMN